MVTVNVDQAISSLTRNFSQLAEPKVKRAIVSAINRTLIKGRTTARKEVKNIYNIPQKNLGGIAKINATTGLMIGYITASTTPIPMDAFAPKFSNSGTTISISRKGVQKVKANKRPSANANKGVSIEVLRGQRTLVPHAFMIAGAKPRVFARGEYKPGGSWGFIKRNQRINKTGNDTPIKPLISVTVHAAVINETAISNIGADVEVYYPQRMIVELNNQLQKMQS
jgi:hypothetical protein